MGGKWRQLYLNNNKKCEKKIIYSVHGVGKIEKIYGEK